MPAPSVNGGGDRVWKVQFSELQRPLNLTRVIWHTVMHHSSTSMYRPNFIEIGQTFCGRTDVPTDGRTFPHLMLLDLKRRPHKQKRSQYRQCHHRHGIVCLMQSITVHRLLSSNALERLTRSHIVFIHRVFRDGVVASFCVAPSKWLFRLRNSKYSLFYTRLHQRQQWDLQHHELSDAVNHFLTQQCWSRSEQTTQASTGWLHVVYHRNMYHTYIACISERQLVLVFMNLRTQTCND